MKNKPYICRQITLKTTIKYYKHEKLQEKSGNFIACK